MTWAMVAAKAVGSALEVTNTLQSGRRGAALEEQQAQAASQQATADEYSIRRQNRANLGALSASMAQYGAGDEGVLRQSGINGELDALNTRYAGAMRAQTLRASAIERRRQSKLLAASQILGGASEAAASYYGSGK